MDLNKTETKFLRDLLSKRITESNRVLENSLKNSLNPNFPYYDEKAYEKSEKKHKGIITRCNAILNKLH